MNRIEFRAMGSRMLAAVDSLSLEAEKALGRVPAWFEQWEQALSRFRPDSELSRLNLHTGQPVAVSETLWEVFQAAREAERFTAGLVTPTVLDVLVQAGYDRSFEQLAPVQTAPIWTIPELPDLSIAIGWDAPTRTLVLPPRVHIDLGGIAKGWAAARAVARLSRYGPALVDAGGDIAVGRTRPGGEPWPVGINDPFGSGKHFETLRLKQCGVATSGKDYHRWLRDGVWVHHIIDPRTGLPAVTNVLAATVVAPTAMEAEAAAKASLILGSQAGMDWLDADPGLAGVLVLEDGSRLYSARMDKYLWRGQ
jgi:thiamine biosynthesis lipoprotein